ncbi:hypothetical protein GE061_002907 [Apolygus lucorum]|uniref:rhomboid protease n=1 Tax=Apolygus lucorum TaxID=248454 RepID=A0A6A4JM53_APOLU|nr:hypothetical protein GE061_002907 [Apolygus lucorum]
MNIIRGGLARRLRTSIIRKCKSRGITTGNCKRQEDENGNSFRQNIEEWNNPNGPLDPSVLIKPFIFTVGFSAVSLGVAKTFERRRIHKEETRIRKRKSMPEDSYYKKPDWITSEDFGSAAFFPIFLLNVVVLLGWRLRPIQPLMVKYFLANPASPTSSWPMLFSAFSHISGVHLLTNMYVLYSFTQVTVEYMGPEQFTGFYFSAAVVSSFASYVARVVLNRPGFSLGASGAVMAVLGYACTLEPEARLGFAFIPFLTMKAGHVLAGLIAADTFGMFSQNSMFDHAAHLGGTIFGIFWATVGSHALWHSDHIYDVKSKKKKK